MSRVTKFAVLAVSLFIIFYVALGYVLGKTASDDSYRALTVYSEVLQRIQQDYVEEPNLPLVTAGALHGLLESLDPNSSYLSSREYADFKKKSEMDQKGETGAVLSKRFGFVVVVSVLPDSPASKAGLEQGDLLEAIGGFSSRDMSIGQADLLMAGEPGTPVKVSVVARRFSTTGQSEEIEIIRRKISYPAVQVDRLEGDLAYLRVDAFNKGKANEIRQALLDLEKQGSRKLVLDLRDCAAGDVKEAIDTAQLFVGSGTLATLRGQTVAEKKFTADPASVVWKHPVSVLISSGTSGPAEVLASALADNPSPAGGKVELVGERTFGSASEQKLIPLDDGAALNLTVANYYRADGKAIPESGVEPTVEVMASTDASDLDAADAAEPPAHMSPATDPVLRRAIELLKNPGAADSESKGQARLAPRRLLDRAA